MSSTSGVDFGFGWDPTLQMGAPKESQQPVSKEVVDDVDDKIAFLQMQQAIVGGDGKTLEKLIASVPLKEGQKRALCRLTLKHFSPSLAPVLKDFPWSEVIKDEHLLSAIKKDQSEAFTFMLSYLNTYNFKHVYHHLMDVNTNNYALYDKYRPALFARLTPSHQQEVAGRFAAQLRHLKPSKVESYYNLAASLADMDWKQIFTSTELYRYTSTSEMWGWGWMIKEFPSVARQYQELAHVQSQMLKDITALVEKIVKPISLHDNVLDPNYRMHKPKDYFTADFLRLCEDKSIDDYRIIRSIGEQAKLLKTHGVGLAEILMNSLKNPFIDDTELVDALSVMYQNTFSKDIPLPLHMLATPVEKVLFNSNHASSVMHLLGSVQGRGTLREYFKSTLYLRLFAHHALNPKVDANKVAKNIDVFQDQNGNTLMHFFANSFFNHLEKMKPWVVDPRLNWEDKNTCGLSPKDLAYQYYGSFDQKMIGTGEEIFNERANNILNANLKKQLLHKKSPSSKRKI